VPAKLALAVAAAFAASTLTLAAAKAKQCSIQRLKLAQEVGVEDGQCRFQVSGFRF
jgi:hypothetical protein